MSVWAIADLPSVHPLHNDCFEWRNVAIAGTRLWDIPGVSFEHLMVNPPGLDLDCLAAAAPNGDPEKVFSRELQRLRFSLEDLPAAAEWRVCLVHFPPIPDDLGDSPVTSIIEPFGIHKVVFGHLHNIPPTRHVFGMRNGTEYILATCDHMDFQLIRILD